MNKEDFEEEIRKLKREAGDQPMIPILVRFLRQKIASVPDYDQLILATKVPLYFMTQIISDHEVYKLEAEIGTIAFEVCRQVHLLKYPSANL